MTKTTKTRKSKRAPRSSAATFTARDWSDIYDALMDAANVHHSGPRADRNIELARKIRETKLTESKK